ncbi:MAG: hypothetical protein R2761_11180 [Acidimicrobiales bacterium]
MSAIDEIHRTTVVAHAAATLAIGDTRRALAERVRRLDPADERGDVEARTVTIAVMVALALAVGVIITAKVTNKANGISLE